MPGGQPELEVGSSLFQHLLLLLIGVLAHDITKSFLRPMQRHLVSARPSL